MDFFEKVKKITKKYGVRREVGAFAVVSGGRFGGGYMGEAES